MKNALMILTVLAAVSCGMEEISRRPQNGAGQVWVKPGGNTDSAGVDKTVAYVVAVDYPDGYNWRIDREKGSVRCSLVVYMDGSPMMKIPVGDEYEVSSDPDMHRMVKGHLYTDFSTDSETVIKKDGQDVIRYPGREMICDLIEHEGDVYTLGHNREGDGFSCRRNGEIIVSRSKGRSFGTLHNVRDTVCFAFAEPVAVSDGGTGTGGGVLERYYLSVNGRVFQTAVREDVRKVWDIVIGDGGVCYLATVVGISSPVLVRGYDMQAMNMPSSSLLLDCRIVAEDGLLFVEGLFRLYDRPFTSGLWNESGGLHMFDGGMTVSSMCTAGNGVCCVLNGASDRTSGLIYRCGETFSIPPGYTAFSSSSATVVNGILYVGLSSLSGAPPLIWKDGETTPLKINGFITSISMGKK